MIDVWTGTGILENATGPHRTVTSKEKYKIPNTLVHRQTKMIDEVIKANPAEVSKYKAGKKKLKGFFVGQVMKKSGGRVDPTLTNQLVEKKLNE